MLRLKKLGNSKIGFKLCRLWKVFSLCFSAEIIWFFTENIQRVFSIFIRFIKAMFNNVLSWLLFSFKFRGKRWSWRWRCWLCVANSLMYAFPRFVTGSQLKFLGFPTSLISHRSSLLYPFVNVIWVSFYHKVINLYRVKSIPPYPPPPLRL